MKKICYLFFSLLILSFSSCNEEKKDEPETTPESPTPTPITVTDKDGNVYNTITIGTQVWMVENLKVTKYNDGTPIPNVTSNTAWAALTTGAYCNYNNDAANGSKYGKLYNWYAVNSGKLAPEGWHIPTKTEWETLVAYVSANLGTSTSISKALAAQTDWQVSMLANVPGNDLSKNNSTGFTALPGGNQNFNGSFYDGGYEGYWWSSTAYDTEFSWFSSVNSESIGMSVYWLKNGNGLSVRCIKD